jgi:hypothetical protein
MKDWKVGLTLVSIYMLLFGAVVAHLIFDLNVATVQIFCWVVDRITVLVITLALLALAYLVELGLAFTVHPKKHARLRLIAVLISLILIVLGLAILQYCLNNDFGDRLVWFDSTLIIIVAAWSIVFWVATRLWGSFHG